MIEVIRIEEKETEVFAHVQFLNEEFGMLSFAKWLTPKEVAEYQATKTEETIETIMAKYEQNAVINKRAEVAAQTNTETLPE